MEVEQTQSPNFNTYSSENLADIAARVVNELNLSQNDPFQDDFYSSLSSNDAFPFSDADQNDAVDGVNDEDDDDDDVESEFEFAVLCGEENSSPISADEIFSNGQIKPMFPLFNTDLVYGYRNDAVSKDPDPPPVNRKSVRLPLRNLLTQERENANPSSSSSSSSEADDLEGVPPGTYCVWAPTKKNDDDMMMIGKKKKKSNSTGSSSSKRWKFRDLLYRSNSDGKDTFVFLTPSGNHHHHGGGGGGGEDSKRREKLVSAGKKSYLPYRPDVVGFFGNVNGLSRTLRPL